MLGRWIVVLALSVCLPVCTTLVLKITERSVKGEVLINDTDITAITSGNDLGILEIQNGSLILNRTLDLDNPENQEFCQNVLQLDTLQGIRGGSSEDIFFVLYTTDDFSPQVNSSDDFTVHIREWLDPPTVNLFEKGLSLIDNDCGTQNLKFRLESQDGLDNAYFSVGGDQGKLLTATNVLDYESQSQYRINITASSNVKGSGVSRTSHVIVNIQVDDVDDMFPVFDDPSYHVTFSEENETNVWKETTPPLHARDGDLGINQTIIYSLLSPPINLIINETTGALMLTQTLDREDRDNYTVVVKASQTDAPDQRSVAIQLVISVSDVNDHRPEFDPDVIEDIEVREGAARGHKLALVLATDKDKGDNAKLTYNVTNDVTGAFTLGRDVSGHWWLVVGEPSNLIGWENINVTVSATETTPPYTGSAPCGQSCRLVLNIRVIPHNLHAPHFTLPYFEFDVNPGHDNVGNISATDKDRIPGSKVVYSLTPLDPDDLDCVKVKVNPSTGEVKLSADMFPGHQCGFVATACDSETEARRCSSVPLTVTSTNTTTSPVPLNLTVVESVTPGTALTTALPRAGLRTDSHVFSVRGRSLYNDVTLDREVTDKYNVSLYEGSSSQPIAVLLITVLDVNDNAPVFTKEKYTVAVENREVGDVILKLQATDDDIDENAALVYDLITGHDICHIDPRSGEISIKSFPDSDDPSPLVLAARARDSGVPQLEDITELKLTFMDGATQRKTDDDDDGLVTPFVIGLLCATGVLLVIVVALVMAVMNKNKEQEQHSRMARHLERDTSIYDNTGSFVDQTSSTKDLLGSRSPSVKENTDSLHSTTGEGDTKRQVNGFVNRAYVTDDSPITISHNQDDDMVVDIIAESQPGDASDEVQQKESVNDLIDILESKPQVNDDKTSLEEDQTNPVFKSVINVTSSSETKPQEGNHETDLPNHVDDPLSSPNGLINDSLNICSLTNDASEPASPDTRTDDSIYAITNVVTNTKANSPITPCQIPNQVTIPQPLPNTTAPKTIRQLNVQDSITPPPPIEAPSPTPNTPQSPPLPTSLSTPPVAPPLPPLSTFPAVPEDQNAEVEVKDFTDEPDPDYQKRVRFGETPSTSAVSPDGSEEGDLSPSGGETGAAMAGGEVSPGINENTSF